MAYFTETTTPLANELSRTAALFTRISLRLRQRRAYRETLKGLSELSNRELDDLGLNRADLRRVSMEAAEATV